jgi:hypothetical protein
MIGYVDIINLQIYNNSVNNEIFESVMYNWLTMFAMWCNTPAAPACLTDPKCFGDTPCSDGASAPVCMTRDAAHQAARQKTCEDLLQCPAVTRDRACTTLPPSSYTTLIEPTASLACTAEPAAPEIQIRLTPRIIKQKFYMGFCGQDCPQFMYDPVKIKKFLPYFRGIMFWAIDESLTTDASSETATAYVQSLIS